MWQNGGEEVFHPGELGITVADKSDSPNSYAADSHSETDLTKSQDIVRSSIIWYSVIQNIFKKYNLNINV